MMFKLHKYNQSLIAILIFFFILTLRLPHLTSSPAEYHAWRQSDTDTIARNFLEQRFNIFYPQLNYDGPMPNHVQLEFQITTFLIAILYKMFGYHYVLARLVPLAFFLASAWFLYCLARKMYSVSTAWYTVILYGIFPFNIYFSRAIMPESAALFFFIGSFYYFLRWIEEERLGFLYLSGIFTALAISQKIPTIFVGIPMIVMALKKYKEKFLTQWQLWVFAFISLGTPFFYFSWLQAVAETDYVSGIAMHQVGMKFMTAIFTPEAQNFLAQALPRAFTPSALRLFLLGVLTLNISKDLPVIIWLAAMLLEVVTVVAVIKLDYYLLLLAPLLALVGGKALAFLGKMKWGTVWVILILFFIFNHSWEKLEFFYRQDLELLEQAQIVQRYTKEDDLIVIGTFQPQLLNLASRKGWRANVTIPGDPEAEMEYYLRNGARFFVRLKEQIEGDEEGVYSKYIQTRFPAVLVKNNLVIYKLGD
jgi:4-amino-4-deoxy-L-arabinose transferase-like glycosyltransferase